MSDYRNKLLNILKDLKENHNIACLKAEFGEEGSSLEETAFLKELASAENLDFTVKIGGCEALRDALNAKKIGADNIVAPMIESEYALQKFVKTIKTAYESNIPENLKLYINIETITGYNNLENILNCKELSEIEGIILGRTDMALSFNKTKDWVESDEMYKIAETIAALTHKFGKKIIIGGNISTTSTKFFKKLYPENIDKFETRKIIFDIKSADEINIAEGITKALKFELTWLEYKKEFFNSLTAEDKKRMESLKDRCSIPITD